MGAVTRGRARNGAANAIPIVIGLIAVIGAFLTWRSVSLGGSAADADRRAILDTTSLQKQQLFTEAQMSFDLVAFAEYRSDLAAAELLDQAVATGTDTSGTLARQAETYRALAANILATGRLPSDYVSGTTSDDVTFDEAARRDALSRANPYVATLNEPSRSVRESDGLYQRHLGLIASIVQLTGAIVVLTVAQLFSGARRLIVGGGGSLMAIIVVLMALGDL